MAIPATSLSDELARRRRDFCIELLIVCLPAHVHGFDMTTSGGLKGHTDEDEYRSDDERESSTNSVGEPCRKQGTRKCSGLDNGNDVGLEVC